MNFTAPLVSGRLIKRYKRFMADVMLDDGTVVTAHCMNSGSMMGLAAPDSRVWLSPIDNPKAKLRYRWEIVEAEGSLVGINTGHPNRIAANAIADGRVPELAGYETIRREVKYGSNSRIDLLLEDHEAGLPPAYVEVKNVTLKRGNGDGKLAAAEFPDAVTARGAKHLRELAEMVRQGYRAVMLYIAQRADCTHFSLAGDIDPAYETAFREARAAGVEMLAYHCAVSEAAIRLAGPLPIQMAEDEGQLMADEGSGQNEDKEQ